MRGTIFLMEAKPDRKAEAYYSMTKFERWISTFLIVTVFGGTLAAVGLKHELWPFSHFPMYSVAMNHREPIPWFEVYGLVVSNGSETEILINRSPHLEPYYEVTLINTLGYFKVHYPGMWADYMEIDESFYRRKLFGLLTLYNTNLKKNLSTDPALSGIRLYEVKYENSIPRPVPIQPSKVKLIAEVRQ